MKNMKKSHLVIIAFQVTVIGLLIVLLAQQQILLKQVRDRVFSWQQQVLDLTVRTQGIVLDLPNDTFVLFEGDIWQKERLQYRESDTGFPVLSIRQDVLANGDTLETFVARSNGLTNSQPLAASSLFSELTENYYRSEVIGDVPVLHTFLFDKWPVHTWYVLDPQDSSKVYIFSSTGSLGTDETPYFAQWILETLRFE